ncbi:restriction endonuclease subunit S domain-containing protein [Streptococcus pneumoniae]|uniref:type I restriction endonuclease n=1 Tax=Streptococcus pneumoniae TaxID=1313 RepID=UPI001EDDE406
MKLSEVALHDQSKIITSEVDGINWIKIGDTEKGEKYINNVKEKIKNQGLTKLDL